MRLFRTASIVFVFISLFIHPSNVSPADGNPQEVIAIALRDAPPQYLIDKKTGEPAGFAIDIMNKVAQLSDLKVRYVVYADWPDALEAVKNNQAVLVPNLGITADRLISYDFTIPYETFRISAFIRSATVDIKEVSDLSGKKVGVVAKNQGLVLMREQGGSDLQIYKSLEEAFMALISGTVDALVCPEPWIRDLATRSGLEGKIKMVGKPLQEVGRGIAVRKGEQALFRKLDNAIRHLIKTPEYKKIYEKWHGTPIPYWTSQRIMWIISGLLLACLLAMALWRYLTITRLNRELLVTMGERRKAEEQQITIGKRFQLLLDIASDGIHILDLDGNLVESSDSFRRMLGYTKEEAATLNIADWDAHLSKEGLLNRFQMQVQGPVLFETMHRRRDGSVFDVEINFRGVEIDGKQYLYASSRDITERKRLEEALREQLHFLGQLLETMPIPIFYKDIYGVFRGCNAAFEKLVGLTKEQIIGETVHGVYPQDLADIYYQADSELFNQPGVQIYETSIQHADGTIHDIIFNKATYVSADGQVAGLIGAIFDITERKRSEETLRQSEDKFRMSFQTSPDAININRLEDGLYVDINQGFTDLFGFTREDVNGRTSREINIWHDPADRKRLVQGLQERGYYENLEAQFLRKDGSLTTALMSARVLMLGKVPHIISVTRDISERKRAEAEKRNLEEQLQRAEKMEALGTLAGGVAHDLNNVLGIIVGYSELLLYDIEGSSPLKPGLMNILSGSQKAAAIVQDLLTLARRGVASRKVINLNQIIVDCQNSPEFENLSSYHSSIKIKTDLEPDLLNISGSAIHLGKMLFNLVSNASEAMPKGGSLTIKTSNQYLERPIQGYDEVREGDYVVLSVSDIGEGIPTADLKRIFEPFYTKKVMGRSGTGLGLAVVWGTVKDHHGYINVQSEEGKGSTFTLYFPVTREEVTAEEVAISIFEYLGKGETILIVDDVKGQRDLAEEMLKKLNYLVTSVSSGEEAVDYLKEHKVDLLVLDMIMDPGLDGLDTYKKVLEISPRQKAIIVSGFSESDRVRSAQSLGAGTYVKKPYVIENLGLAVRKELERTT